MKLTRNEIDGQLIYDLNLQSVLDITDVNCVFEGDLVEVDPETFLPKSKIHAFLLHDSMVVANIIQNRYCQQQ